MGEFAKIFFTLLVSLVILVLTSIVCNFFGLKMEGVLICGVMYFVVKKEIFG